MKNIHYFIIAIFGISICSCSTSSTDSESEPREYIFASYKYTKDTQNKHKGTSKTSDAEITKLFEYIPFLKTLCTIENEKNDESVIYDNLCEEDHIHQCIKVSFHYNGKCEFQVIDTKYVNSFNKTIRTGTITFKEGSFVGPGASWQGGGYHNFTIKSDGVYSDNGAGYEVNLLALNNFQRDINEVIYTNYGVTTKDETTEYSGTYYIIGDDVTFEFDSKKFKGNIDNEYGILTVFNAPFHNGIFTMNSLMSIAVD